MQSSRKPFPLIASALWWSILTVAAFGYATYVNFRVGSSVVGVLILAALFSLTCSLLWFLWSYWRGHDWTRTLVLIGLVLKLVYELFYLFEIHYFPHTPARRALFTLRIGDMLFCAYILFWLFTKEAKQYFRFPRPDWEPTKSTT